MRYCKIIFLTLLLISTVRVAYAQLEPVNAEEYGLPSPASDIKGLISSMVNWVAIIAAAACTVALVYGGLRYAFAGGNEEKVDKAKKVMKYATIGVAIVIGGYAITQLITALIKGEVPTAPSLD